jgi:hypothetical protein
MVGQARYGGVWRVTGWWGLVRQAGNGMEMRGKVRTGA